MPKFKIKKIMSWKIQYRFYVDQAEIVVKNQIKYTFIMIKRKFKQWWSTIPPIWKKRPITSHLEDIKKNMTYDFGNPGPDLRQAQKCGRVNLVNGIPTPF